LPRPLQHVDEDLIGQDVQLLLVLALDVGGAGEAEDAGEAGLGEWGERIGEMEDVRGASG
jgi:hypothetical protein